MKRSEYKPRNMFERPLPRVMIAPARYVQGAGVLDELGRYLRLVPAKSIAVLLTSGGERRIGARLRQSFTNEAIAYHFIYFDGECSYEEVDRAAKEILACGQVDAVVAVGGGKCVDAGKAVAFRVEVPVVVCPTLASTDAPTSAVAVMYTPDGIGLGGEFYKESPALVVMDTGIIAQAPRRYLAAGMADALASIYEIEANLKNPNGWSMVGGRPPLSVHAMANAVREVLFRDGAAALEAVQEKKVTESLENVVEVNTLASGIGFESGGLAVVHAVALGLTAIATIRERFLHGELVAIGILCQLIMLEDLEEARAVVDFFRTVGLPTGLGDIGLQPEDESSLKQIAAKAASAPFVHNVGFEVTSELIASTLANLDSILERLGPTSPSESDTAAGENKSIK